MFIFKVIEWKSEKLPENFKITPNVTLIDFLYHMYTYKEEINGKCLFKVYFNCSSFVTVC